MWTLFLVAAIRCFNNSLFFGVWVTIQYFMIVFNGEKEAVNELERNFRIDENILRFLTSKADSIPSEPTPIMKYKIEKENAESYVNEVNLETSES